MKSYVELKSRWEIILNNTKKEIPEILDRYHDSQRNIKGDFNSVLHMLYRDFATLDYLLNRNSSDFKVNMIKATECMIELLQRYENGDPISPSQMHMLLFTELFDALASGDIPLAIRFAHYMGGRPEIEDMYDSEYTLCMGYALKYATENNMEALQSWLPRLKALCENPKNRMLEFTGYYMVFEAFSERSVERLEKAFQVLLEGHKKKCRSAKGPDFGPYFHDSPDADVFVWGIGLANLCRYYGMKVKIDDPLIPNELLID